MRLTYACTLFLLNAGPTDPEGVFDHVFVISQVLLLHRNMTCNSRMCSVFLARIGPTNGPKTQHSTAKVQYVNTDLYPHTPVLWHFVYKLSLLN